MSPVQYMELERVSLNSCKLYNVEEKKSSFAGWIMEIVYWYSCQGSEVSSPAPQIGFIFRWLFSLLQVCPKVKRMRHHHMLFMLLRLLTHRLVCSLFLQCYCVWCPHSEMTTDQDLPMDGQSATAVFAAKGIDVTTNKDHGVIKVFIIDALKLNIVL